jgi:hypothetical protein
VLELTEISGSEFFMPDAGARLYTRDLTMATVANEPKAFYITRFSVLTDSIDNPLPRSIHRVTFASTYDSENNIYSVTSTVTFYVADPEPAIIVFVSAYVSF